MKPALQEGIYARYYKAGKKPMAHEVIRPKGESTTVASLNVVKLPSKNLCLVSPSPLARKAICT